MFLATSVWPGSGRMSEKNLSKLSEVPCRASEDIAVRACTRWKSWMVSTTFREAREAEAPVPFTIAITSLGLKMIGVIFFYFKALSAVVGTSSTVHFAYFLPPTRVAT
jgi:hypothetical protein